MEEDKKEERRCKDCQRSQGVIIFDNGYCGYCQPQACTQGNYFPAHPTDPDFEARRAGLMAKLSQPIGKAHPEPNPWKDNEYSEAPAVAFDAEVKFKPRNVSHLLKKAKLLEADMIQCVAEDDQDVSRIEAAFEILFQYLGGDR